MSILSQQKRWTSLWPPLICCSYSLLKGLGEWNTERHRGRGDTSPRHQWAFTHSLRYLFLLCFWASSIKYETLRQKEGEWKGWQWGPQRAPLNAFEEALRRGVSWVQMYAPCTNTHTNTPIPKWCGQIRWQISTFASCVFRSVLAAIPQKGCRQCN